MNHINPVTRKKIVFGASVAVAVSGGVKKMIGYNSSNEALTNYGAVVAGAGLISTLATGIPLLGE